MSENYRFPSADAISAPVLVQHETLGRALRRDAVANRQRLLRAAAEVFAREGLEAGVEEIARVAGVGIGTLYRRFPTKDALIAELVRDLLTDVLALARAALSVPGGGGLEHFLYAACEDQVAQCGCLARLWTDAESAALKSECRAVIRQLLTIAQDHGRVRTDANLADVDLILWSLRGVIEAAQEARMPASRRHIALMVAGLRPSPEPLGVPMLPADGARQAEMTGLNG